MVWIITVANKRSRRVGRFSQPSQGDRWLPDFTCILSSFQSKDSFAGIEHDQLFDANGDSKRSPFFRTFPCRITGKAVTNMRMTYLANSLSTIIECVSSAPFSASFPLVSHVWGSINFKMVSIGTGRDG